MKNIRHAGIIVRNMEQSLKFYRDLLELQIQKETRESGDYLDNILSLKKVALHVVKLSADDNQTLIELIEFLSHTSASDKNKLITKIGTSHVAFTVNDLQTTYKKLRDNGVYFNCPPQVNPEGTVKVTYCKDPDENFIELVEEI